jgi:HlyD family secretion protein
MPTIGLLACQMKDTRDLRGMSMRKWIVLIIVILISLAVGGWYWKRGNKSVNDFRTATVDRGDLTSTISATGTVEPEEVVDVGAQLSGTIDYFGKDLHNPGHTVDYRSEVDEGEVLAHLDESLYAANVSSAQGAVDQGKANVQKAVADQAQSQAKLVQAGNDWKRAQDAGVNAGLSKSDIDQYKANYDVAVATVADAKAAILQAQTGVSQSEAQLAYAKRNLSYCTIKSPVKGTIIDRRVNIGQTVAAAMNTPSLFLVAKDLKRIQVWASVNEADIGNIKAGQPATFTVDAFPGHIFHGTVGKVRLNATMTSNVVTYTVEVEADNSDGKLLPYLTAKVDFQIEKKADVLMVPNAALRWVPTADQIAPEARQSGTSATDDTQADPSVNPTKAPIVAMAARRAHGTIWVLDGHFVKPVDVQLGLTDGFRTEVAAENLSEGATIVVGENEMDGGGAAGGSPFLPHFPTRKRG